jgi:flagellin
MDAGESDFEFQVGAATGAPNRITVTIDGMTSVELGLGGSSGIQRSDFSISQNTNAGGTNYDTLNLEDVGIPSNTSTDTFDLSFAVADAATDTNTAASTLTLFGESVTLTGVAQTDEAAIRSAFGGFGVTVQTKTGYDTGSDASAVTNTDGTPAAAGLEGQGNAYLTLTVPQSGASANLSVSSADNSRTSIGAVDAAILKVNNQRSELGAVSNRLNHTVNNLTNISSNLSAAKGGIEDADFALETTNLAKNQILQQASTAMLAQANASQQNVLALLRS